jgi:hypothetical protein
MSDTTEQAAANDRPVTKRGEWCGTTDQLAAAIGRVISKRGAWYGRVGYLLLLLIDDDDYLRAELPTDRQIFIRMLFARAGELRRQGFELTFTEVEGPCVLIERTNR